MNSSASKLQSDFLKNAQRLSIADLIINSAKMNSEKVAVVCGDRTLSYGEFHQFIRRTQQFLTEKGIERGDRVAVRVTDKLSFIKITFAIMCSGFIAVPLDRTDPEAQEEVIADADPRIVIHDSSLEISPSDHPHRIFAEGSNLDLWDEGALSYVKPNDYALILYTSGTHGLRKGVLLTHSNLVRTAAYIVDFTGLSSDAVEFVAAPIEHAFGFGRPRCIFAVGGTLVLDPQPFNPIRALAVLGREKCNALSSVSTGYAMLVEYFSDAFAEFRRQIKWMEIGSVPLRKPLIDRLCRLFPHTAIVMNYGMTEAQRTTLINFQSERDWRETSGRASPGLTLRVCNEDRIPLPPNTVGIIEVSGANVAVGYWRNETMWQKRYSDGWFQTDDLGVLNEEGYLRFIGRRDDMINVGGEKVSPVDIEFSMQPCLDDVSYVVCAKSDPAGIYGEIPVLCIEGETSESFSWKELRAKLLKKLETKYVPRSAVLIPSFPRTKNGKIQRKKIRELLEQSSVRVL